MRLELTPRGLEVRRRECAAKRRQQKRVLIYINGGVAERLNAAVLKFRDRHPGPFRLMPIRTLTLGFRPSQYPLITPLPTSLVSKMLATAESLSIGESSLGHRQDRHSRSAA
jgi:hypothetical protein